MKGQDVLVLLATLAHPEKEWTFPALSQALKISASEAHAAVRRLVAAGLLDSETRRPRRQAAEEFLLHGLKYVFPGTPGASVAGVPTAHSAEPLSRNLVVADGDAYVWPHVRGTVRGQSVTPLYRSAPDAALEDPALHRLLSLVDALRVGRARERSAAAKELVASIRHERAK